MRSSPIVPSSSMRCTVLMKRSATGPALVISLVTETMSIAGENGQFKRLLHREKVGDGAHLHVVGDNDAVVAELFAQQAGDDGG